MDYVEPKMIQSPYTGKLVKPQLKVHDMGDRIITEAWWYCPDSGQFITKGVVSEKAKDTGKEDKAPKEKHD